MRIKKELKLVLRMVPAHGQEATHTITVEDYGDKLLKDALRKAKVDLRNMQVTDSKGRSVNLETYRFPNLVADPATQGFTLKEKVEVPEVKFTATERASGS